MTRPSRSKTERIDVRTGASAKQLSQAAVQALADRRRFVLDEARWQAFQDALDRPVQGKPHLAKLLREPGVLG